MTDLVIVPFGARYLALPREQFDEALALGDEMVPPKMPSPAHGHEQWLTVDAVVERTGLSRSYVYEAVRTKEIPSRNFGRSVRIPASYLDDVDNHSNGQSR